MCTIIIVIFRIAYLNTDVLLFNGTYRMVAISPARPQREDEVGQRVQAGW